MQFIILAIASLAAASPAMLRARAPINICPALDTPQCCQADVDGVLALTCETPTGSPSTVAAFKKTCADEGTTAFCCTVPVAGDALLCDSP